MESIDNFHKNGKIYSISNHEFSEIEIQSICDKSGITRASCVKDVLQEIINILNNN